MIENDQAGTEKSRDQAQNGNESRIPRTVRFSDSEWKKVKSAAAGRGVSLSAFVREAVLGRAAGAPGTGLHADSPAFERLIRSTFRYVVVMSTLKRNETIRAGHRKEVDRAVEYALKAEAELLSRAVDDPAET